MAAKADEQPARRDPRNDAGHWRIILTVPIDDGSANRGFAGHYHGNPPKSIPRDEISIGGGWEVQFVPNGALVNERSPQRMAVQAA